MDRRGFLGFCTVGGMVGAPAFGQETRVYRVAVISPSESPVEQFKQVVIPELARLGFATGRNLAITYHVGAGPDMPKLAAEAAATQPDVVVASTILPVFAMLKASETVPIVMSFVGDDPVVAGLAKSYAKPGGRVTGLTNLAHDLDAKRLSLLRETLPGARKFAVLSNRPPRHVESVENLKRLSREMNVELFVTYADHDAEYPAAFSAIRAEGAQGLLILGSPDFTDDAVELARLALEMKLPTICEAVTAARSGLLIGYGVDREAFRRRTAPYIARILRGAAPGDLPIEQPTTLEFAVNLRTARLIGIELPQQVLLRADEVIE